MGFWNPRAICPKCGGKIHTRGRGILGRTGTSCQHCSVALTGQIGLDNRAKLAQHARKYPQQGKLPQDKLCTGEVWHTPEGARVEILSVTLPGAESNGATSTGVVSQ